MQTALDLTYAKVQDNSTRLFQPHVNTVLNDRVEIYSIELTDRWTKIDFVAYANSSVPGGGILSIDRQIYIRPSHYTQRYALIQAVDAPLAPSNHFFNGRYDEVRFSLYFPAMEKEVTHIDIVEPKGSFSFYGISLKKAVAA